MKKQKLTFDSRIEYGLILPAFLLIMIGFLVLYIATSHDYPNRLSSVMTQQITWGAAGIVVAFIVMLFNAKMLWKFTPILYVLGIILMLLPLKYFDPLTFAATGSKNWVYLGGNNLFQPSEFMKLSYTLLMARMVVDFQNRLKQRHLRDDFLLIFYMLLVTAPVIGLLNLQKDFGTALVFMAIFAGIVIVSGISWRIILPIVMLVALIGGGIIYLTTVDYGRDFLISVGVDSYQISRIDAWRDPFIYAQGTTYQQAQGQIAIGTGGLFGQGFNVANISVPVRESDMIFTVIGENFGFVGSTFVIFLYFILIYRMIRVTIQANNQFYIYISTGIIMMILFHVFENIGANIGVLPLTGIPLPFISQGGSSLIGNLIGIGLVLSMKYNQLPDFPKESKRKPYKRITKNRTDKTVS
ncbi:rod shape-determining protein RodA [Lactococcus hodotermopsidis]|uniref:Rod shape-determining protein RodA n=1 Tax=Pseudolactococcus hodotermopsidis TaxID=2709157 RepID=A0A6A0BI07_9LACT|nr:FtsW/RodA/SpoVE family cell cycle protein [Lactococcus hodotermopsidis]GFH43387.1 rod shape-determining protein RodA [Lactococcus hodotermopsidis]